MSFLRRRAVWLATGIVLVQVVAFGAAAATAALCCRRASSIVQLDCCKGSGHACPLMKKHHAPAESDSSLKSCPGKDDRIASLLFGAQGVLRLTIAIAATPDVVTAAETSHLRADSLARGIDSPPPRA